MSVVGDANRLYRTICSNHWSYGRNHSGLVVNVRHFGIAESNRAVVLLSQHLWCPLASIDAAVRTREGDDDIIAAICVRVIRKTVAIVYLVVATEL